MVSSRVRTLARRAAAGVAALAALGGCNTNFAPQYLVRDLRILAARAEVEGNTSLDASDPDTGESVRLTALVANPEGLPDLVVRWKACLPPADLRAEISPCLDPAVLRDPSLLEGRNDVVDLGTGESIVVAIPPELQPVLQALIDRASATPSYACTLYAELPVLAVASAGGRSRMSVQSVRLTPWREVLGTKLQEAYARNRNPGLTAIRAGATDPDACSDGTEITRSCAVASDCGGSVPCVLSGPPGGPSAPGQCADPLPPAGMTVALCPRPSEGSVQVYKQCNADGTRIEYLEDLSFQWFTTAGTLKETGGSSLGGSGNVTGTDVTFEAPAVPYTLWVIVRDGRGGTGWIRRDVVP